MLSVLGHIVWVGDQSSIFMDGAKVAIKKYAIRGHDALDGAIAFAVIGAEKIKEFDIKRGDIVTVTLCFDIRDWNGVMVNEVRCVAVSHLLDIAGKRENDIKS